jgi:Na+/H+-dicarboxylate symporter
MSRTTLNVMGDLTAVSVLDRFVSSPKSYHEEINQEKAMEKQRTQKTQETIVK